MPDMKRGFYTVTQLSKNMYLDNDGMLICQNAVLGKAGTQAYAGYELGLDTSDIILLNRPEVEVFDSESLSSLKGKTLTLNHPDEDVNVENYGYLAKGFVLDVRREGNLIIGDIKITDPEVIDMVMNKDMVELSLGYDTKLVKSDDGKFNQTEIVYNHLALVKKGRAEVARIVDGHKLRVIDKQFEEGGNSLEKDTMLQRVLSALGLRKVERDGDEVYVQDALEEVVKEQTEEVTNESEADVTLSEDLTSVTTDEEPTDVTTVEDNETEAESLNVTDTVTEDETKVTVEAETTDEVETDTVPKSVTDEKKEGEHMDKFEAILNKMKQVESIEDAEFRQTLKDSLLKELQEVEVKPETKVADESNEALEDFSKGTITDSQPVEKVDFDKEIKALYDSLNPHNYDSYEEYIKARKKLDREARAENIQAEVDLAMGGIK